ncbi:uncharacterized protein Z519_07192 [Cladophialophora bantiana CBS 173.52]|uniref:DUF1254 domain-containing protein n=1 Tax=Cladophialophora bantiana (strain ATCC 10958 / CBS 173.52 / CDC B-1940 / NIH 8579) TaxID=1442370 RepID=A0A0D2HG07_CLAB1|nr:uncharacterized protein Z519_07192 [Cladophialophora bantiana CBS 173.52]KIW92208.1 hypothetical protein Z519_07192 [Cladophialophora bantiana CBS 173.52]
MSTNILALFLVCLVGCAQVARTQSSGSSCAAQGATEWSLEYGIPLLAYEKAVGSLFKAGIGANRLIASSTLATPQSTAVVKPNRDTLYASVWYDLSQQDLVVDVPQVDNRYFAVSFYTPYGDNYMNLGPVGGNPTGDYLLTLAPSSSVMGTLSTSSSSGGYMGTVYSPTTFGVILFRVLLRNAASDLSAVNEIIKGYNITVVSRNGSAVGPALDMAMFTNLPNSTAQSVMELNARFEPVSPYNATGDKSPPTTSNFTQAGISGAAYTAPNCVNMTSAWTAAQTAVQTFPLANGSVLNMGNGWTINNPEYSGLYGTNIVARAFIAQFGYLMLQPDQAIYPSFSGNLSLMANESYILRFSGRPPLTKLGFWSATMYNVAGYFVENPINRYSLGDRDNITYPDGSPVYGPGSDSTVDKPFDILVQADQPPSNWTSNWLPSPAEPGPFVLLLRWYVPELGLSNGSYVYPLITKGGAITGDVESQSSPSPAIPSSSAEPTSGSGSGTASVSTSAASTASPSSSSASSAAAQRLNPLATRPGSNGMMQQVLMLLVGMGYLGLLL